MDIINISEIKDALERSGYLLENRILSKFLLHNFWAESNHTFFININENKYREIDIMAHKSFEIIELNNNEYYSLYTHFIVECINNPQPLLLFENLVDFDEPSSDWIYEFINGTIENIEKISLSIPYIIQDIEATFKIEKSSKQYCSFMKKKGDHKDPWMATHPDDFHKTLTKFVDCVKYKIKDTHSKWDGVRPQMGRIEIFIPVVVLQNNLFKITQKSEIEEINCQKLKTPYEEIYNRNISIDIVQEKYFDEYLTMKMKLINKICEQIKREIINKNNKQYSSLSSQHVLDKN